MECKVKLCDYTSLLSIILSIGIYIPSHTSVLYHQKPKKIKEIKYMYFFFKYTRLSNMHLFYKRKAIILNNLVHNDI